MRTTRLYTVEEREGEREGFIPSRRKKENEKALYGREERRRRRRLYAVEERGGEHECFIRSRREK